MIMKINCYFLNNEKYLKIYITKDYKIKEITEKIDDNNLEFVALCTKRKTDFSKKGDHLTFLNKIKKGEITREEVK